MLSKFGIMLRMIRSSYNEPLRAMADKLGVSAPFLSMMEMGSKNIPLEYADRIKDLYNIDYDTYRKLVDSIMETNRRIDINIEGLSQKQIDVLLMFIDRIKNFNDTQLDEMIKVLDPKKNNKPRGTISLVKGNIVDLRVDAIVNSSNHRLAPGSGVCGAIFDAAGYDELVDACRKIGGCETGYAVITRGFNLPARYIIHTVGPRYSMPDAQKKLAMAYYNSLKLADERHLRTIAFPSISTGVYGYPITRAVPVSLKAINDFFDDYPDTSIRKVILCAYNDEAYNEYSKYLKGDSTEE